MSDLLLTGIGRLVTNDGPPIEQAAVLVEEGRVVFSGPEAEAPRRDAHPWIDCEGRAVIPGLIDPHTHLVFAGDRSDEFARRLQGESYAQLAAEGGGILSTVAATRRASEEELFALASARAWRMIDAGTTTLEIKSGYGLDLETELRLLRVARRIGDQLPVTVKTTLLGAHALPPEYATDRNGYLDLVCETMIPAAVGLADYCDVFVEDGAFSVGEAARVLASAAAHGLRPRVHAEQLGHTGGARLAAETGAVTADHLDHVTEEDADLLAAAGVVAVLTPGASYSLRSSQAPGPMLLEHGVTLALGTDCNPGTSYFESMAPVMSLACVQMGLGVTHALYAATRGSAQAMELPDHGAITTGAVGDLVILDAPSETHLVYRPATNLVWKTVKGGVVVSEGDPGAGHR